LGHGLRRTCAEQIYLLLRVALAERLTKPGEVCPLILDEVTLQADRERKQAMLEVLRRLSAGRQVILFTQEDDVRAWAEANLSLPQDVLIRLDGTGV
jgi:uncharacterized protein YhaN